MVIIIPRVLVMNKNFRRIRIILHAFNFELNKNSMTVLKNNRLVLYDTFNKYLILRALI